MTLSELISGFPTTPFLFVGSGFSRRYYNLPDWAGLLRVFSERMSDDEFVYNKYLNKARADAGSVDAVLPVLAELLQRDFDERWFSDPQFRQLDETHLQYVHDNQSPFKVEIAQYIENNSKMVPQKEDELRLLKEISSKSLAGIITTNYDCLLEEQTDGYSAFVGQEELVFSAIQGWAEIYKIHGSITNPSSIVLTQSDYKEFDERCPYLASKLMTIFMEYPIIFMGYSLNDTNVRTILQSIVKCLSEENLDKLQNRFVYVEWVADKEDIEIANASITIEDKTIRLTSIKTDNFTRIFEALGQKKASLPAKLVRLFKQEFYNYALTNQPSATIRVADIEDPRVGDEELVLAIGKPSQFNLRGLRGLTVGEWYRNIVMRDLDFSADDILDYAYPPLIRQNNMLPLNMLLKESKRPHPDCQQKVLKSFDSTLSSTIKRSRTARSIPHRSVNGILADNPDDRNKAMNNIAHLYEHEIDCEQLETFLRECFSHPNFYDELKTGERTNLNRLVKIYDYLRYGR